MSLHACSVQTTEDAENLEIAKSMRVGDQKQKYMYDLEWPKIIFYKYKKHLKMHK